LDTAQQAGTATKPSPAPRPDSPSPELLSALSGLEANRERTVATRTRRVVSGSLGVLREQKEHGHRTRAIALAGTIILLLLLTPLAWQAADSLIAGERLSDPTSQFALWACIVSPTILAAALVAGWWKHRS